MDYRVAIIGGGPAGMSAALWLHHLNCQPTLFEQSAELGGQTARTYEKNPWVLGIEEDQGLRLSEQLIQHWQKINIHHYCNGKLKQLRRQETTWQVQWQQQEHLIRLDFDALLIATGLIERGMECVAQVKGLENCPRTLWRVGAQAYQPEQTFHGKKILIIGGGDNAFENADWVIHRGGQVIMASRSPRQAQHRLVAKISQHQQQGRCTLLCPAELIAIDVADHIRAHIKTKEQTIVEKIDGFHLLAGYQPTPMAAYFSAAAAKMIDYDARGYIKTDALGRTRLPFCYVAGDVAHPEHPCVISALNSGAAAARAIEHDLHQRARENP